MSILIDEQGRPILLFADQDNKKRTKGLDAYKVIFIILTINRQTLWLQEE